jgi:hypothetical protein
LSTCSSYVKAGCFIDTAGDCTFALSVGATTGTKTCRPKQCEDIADERVMPMAKVSLEEENVYQMEQHV